MALYLLRRLMQSGFVLVAIVKFPLFYVLLGLGSLGCVLAYRNLR